MEAQRIRGREDCRSLKEWRALGDHPLLIGTEMASTGPACVCTRSSCCSHYLGSFMGLQTVGTDVPLTLLPALRSPFLMLNCLSSLYVRAFALSFCILFCCVLLLSHARLLFSEGMGRERRESG